jgi:hypothetical protein
VHSSEIPISAPTGRTSTPVMPPRIAARSSTASCSSWSNNITSRKDENADETFKIFSKSDYELDAIGKAIAGKLRPMAENQRKFQNTDAVLFYFKDQKIN